MASPSVLTFDAEGRAFDFEVWLDDLQLFLQCDSKDGLSLFDLTSGASTAPAADADSTVRSQWLTRDAAARLAVRSHLPSTERAHFSQYKSGKTLYDAVVARYSSPATAALSRLMLPYLFPDLAAFATVTDLITHLCTSDTRYHVALPAEFCAKTPPPPPPYHFLSLFPTTLTVDLLEERLLAAETSITAVGASRGDPRTPFFEGCSPVPLLPSVASAAAVDLVSTKSVSAASAPSERRRNGKGKQGKGAGGGGGGGGSGGGGGGGGGGGSGGRGGGFSGSGGGGGRGGGGGWGGGGGGGSGGGGAGRGGAVQRGPQHQPRSRETPSPQQLREWYAGRQGSGGAGPCAYVLRTGDRTGEQCGGLHATQRCIGRLTDAWRTQFPNATEIPRWGDLLKSGPVLARYSTVLPCPAAPSGSLSGLYLPSFSTNLVSGADLQDGGVDQFTPTGQRVTHCTCARTGRHLATFTRRPGSSLYTLTTESPPAAASGQVAASSQVFAVASRSGPETAPCLCRLLSHQTLLWHHRLGHPSLPHLRGMASRVLVSGLPRSLPPLPPGPAPTCVPYVEGRQRAAPHSSELPPTEAPLQTLHMDVWGPARVCGQGHERYFLLVVDDYSRYTTVFPLRRKDEVTEVLIDWIRVARLQLRERFGSDFPVLRLHSDRGGDFSSDLLRAFCHAEGIRQTFTLPASPQQNGIAERRIGMVMDVAHTTMIHAAAPHFLWPFAVQYAAHQINLQPRVSMPETSPTLRWMGKVGDASAFRVWGSRACVRDLSADKLSSRAVPCVFLGFPPDAPGWQFYHPTSRRVLSSQDGPAPSGVSKVDAVEPVEVAVDSGAGSGGAEPEHAEPGGAGSGGAEPERAEPGGAGSRGAEPEVAEGGGAESASAGPGGSSGDLSRRELPSPLELREWFARRWSRAAGAGGAAGAGVSASTEGARTGGNGGSGAAGPGGATGAGATSGAGAGGATGVGATGGAGAGAATSAGGPAGAGAAGGTGAGGATGAGAPVGAGASAPGAAGGTTGAGGAAGGGADAGGAGVVPAGSGGAAWPRPYFVPLLEQVLGLPPSSGPAPSLECPPPIQSESHFLLASPLLAPSPYAGPTGGLAERREHESRPASPVCIARASRRVPRPRPPAVPGTHQMALRPSTAPQRVPLPSPPESSLPAFADRIVELVDFAAHCRLDYATSLVAESASVSPPSVGGECALSTDVLEDRQEEFQCFAAALPHLVSMLLAPEGDPDAPDIPTPRSYAEAIEGPYSSQWQAAMDAEMASWKSTGTYIDEFPPPGANIVSGMWIFRVKRPPGSPPVFKARCVARGFSQRLGADYFHTFSPTSKMTTLRVLMHVAAQRDYDLHSLEFSTTFLQGSPHEEIWLRRPPGFTGSFPPGTQWSLRRPVYGLRQAPREWHDTLRTTLAALGFAPSTADPSSFLRTDT
ncbi:unnamed protein product [Closterium sp. NIES-53]